MAILFGLAVFAVLVAVGWRSVQNRRILRLKDASGHETIVVAGEDDAISSVDTTTEAVQSEPESTELTATTDVVARDRLHRAISSPK